MRVLLAMILGGVPVKVNKPPVLEPNATGINNFEGKVPAFHAAETVTGSKAATVPVLLTKPESTLAPKVTITNNLGTLFFAQLTKRCPAIAVQPVLESPSPIINRAAIIITVALLNPLNASSAVKIPVRKSVIIEINATTSGGNFPQIKRRIVMVRMIKSVIIWNLSSY